MSVLRVPTFQKPLVLVDIETNGLNHVQGRAIEIAAIRIEDGEVVRTFNSLLDPETPLPQFITTLTGINPGDLAGAPTFDQIAEELKDVLDGAIFVAHNVRFDYSFIKQEFARLGIKFLPKQLCTVKLSRALYSHERKHRLEDLITRHNFTYKKRHRAYDDAAVLWQFLQHISKQFPPEQIEAAIAKQIRQPAIPKGIDPKLVRGLPESSGVYIFEDAAGSPLYIGKSINVKKRVLSHFGRDHAESKEYKIAQSIQNIRVHETPGELAALLLESKLVKQMQPVYNRKLRRMQKLMLLRSSYDTNGYLVTTLEEADEIDPTRYDDILAVYSHRGKAKRSLESVLKMHDLCPKLLGLEKARGACFLSQLNKCQGACAGKESPEAYNQRLAIAFERQRFQVWPYPGPVLVAEKPFAESHGFIVDQWCILGELSQEAYCEPVVKTQDRIFDVDTYEILRMFFSAKIDKLSIKRLPPVQLQSLLGVQ
jgi:DNA polymerase-3 subunit epsilon